MEISNEGVLFKGKMITHYEALLFIADVMKDTQELWDLQDFTHSDMYYRFKYSYFGEIGGVWEKEEEN